MAAWNYESLSFQDLPGSSRSSACKSHLINNLENSCKNGMALFRELASLCLECVAPKTLKIRDDHHPGTTNVIGDHATAVADTI